MKILYPDDQITIHPTVMITPQVSILGKVTLKEESSIWFQSVLRGDVDEIVIGARTNIQDGTIVHCVRGYPTLVGADVSVGHGAVLHGCEIGDNCLIGMRATILTGARIGNNCLIAAGALVPEGMEIPDNSLVLGMPAKVKGQVTSEHLELIKMTTQNYVDYAKHYSTKYTQFHA